MWRSSASGRGQGHIACRRGASVLAVRTDQMLKTLKHARLDNSHEAELRKLISVDLLLLDDFVMDAMDATESLVLARHTIRRGSLG
jgi:DNA replication protein DnaC